MRPSGRSDAELLAGGAPGDFGVFYDRHVRAVSSYVAARVRQPEVMFDLVAETFARALESRKQFDPARGPAVGWLIGIARNLIADSARRGQVEAASRVRLGMVAVELDDGQLERITAATLAPRLVRCPPISARLCCGGLCSTSPTRRSRGRCAVLSRWSASGSRAPWRLCERTWRKAMSDPFDTLRSELVRAAARAEVASPRRRWSWVRTRPHGVAAVLAALVICGGGAAAAVSLTASRSQPLSGRVPGRIQPARGTDPMSVAGYQYSIRVTPDLATGSAGWAVWTAYKGPPYGGGLGGGGGGGYPTPTASIFQGSGVAPWSIPTGPGTRGDSVASVLTGPQVAAVRIGNRSIQTFTSALLPTGDRAAVFFLSGRAPTPVVGWRPGQPIASRMRVPEPTAGGRLRWTTIATTALIPLNSAGHPRATTFGPDSGYLRGWSFWQAPSAVTPRIHEPRYHGQTPPEREPANWPSTDCPGSDPSGARPSAASPPSRDTSASYSSPASRPSTTCTAGRSPPPFCSTRATPVPRSGHSPAPTR